MPNDVGPVYCETGHPWLFVSEPVNSVTNLAILIAAIFGLRALLRAPRPWPLDVIAMVVVLFGCAVGSFLWHTFRTRMFLTLDVVPGLLFLFIFIYAWIRRLASPVMALTGLGGLVAAMTVMMGSIRHAAAAGTMTRTPLMFVPVFGLILAGGLLLVALTRKRFGWPLARASLIVVTAAALAALFRTIDLETCAALPVGTHFLWHFGLSTAAYLGIRLTLRLDAVRASAN